MATSAATANILDFKYNFGLGAGDNGNVTAITNNRFAANRHRNPKTRPLLESRKERGTPLTNNLRSSLHGEFQKGYLLFDVRRQGKKRKGRATRQVLKQRVSRRLRAKRRKRKPTAQLSLRFGDSDASLPQFWQARFHDFNVWSAIKIREKLNYMHRNPLARKLVEHPKDWPWRSWSFYAKGELGLVRVDPAG